MSRLRCRPLQSACPHRTLITREVCCLDPAQQIGRSVRCEEVITQTPGSAERPHPDPAVWGICGTQGHKAGSPSGL